MKGEGHVAVSLILHREGNGADGFGGTEGWSVFFLFVIVLNR